MEDNKNIVSEKETSKKANRQKKIKNQFSLKKGTYSVAITAIFIAGIVVLNILMSALSDRFVLEYDMSAQKVNSIDKGNADYIKGIKDEVNIIVCANEKNYAEGEMAYYSQMYGVDVYSSDATDYYNQTVKLINLYGNYNKNIKVKFVDPQTSEFDTISQKYSNTFTINYGDIIVECEKNNNIRNKLVGYEDIYVLSSDSTIVNGNNIETALTSAISYVVSAETKTLAFVTGHSKTDYTSLYKEMLETNNYEITEISDSIINSIPEEVDALILVAPTIDFMGSELDVISQFLENGGNLKKGLLFFGDATTPYLPNLYDFLAQWGIVVDEGVLYETDSDMHLSGDPTTMVTLAASEDEICKNVNFCISGKNVPLTVGKDTNDGIVTEAMVATNGTTVAAPVGTTAGWTEADKYTEKSYAGFIQAAKESFDDDNNPIGSYVMAFSSVDFIYSAYVSESAVSNADLALAAAERAVSAEDSGISFTMKTISNESYYTEIKETDVKNMRRVFMLIIPLIMVIVGTYVYIKRRNA